MKTIIKYFLLLAIYTNSLAMDDEDHNSHINPFFSEDTESPTKPTGSLNSFGFGTSASGIFSSTEPEPVMTTRTVRTAQDPQESSAFTCYGSLFNFGIEDLSELTAISTTAPESDMGTDLDTSTPDGLLSQLRTSETQSPTPPDSDATSELDITAPARKTRRRSLSATSTSSSSASAASPTDTQSTSKASELGTSRKRLKPKTFVTTQPLPCLWPLETAGPESTCNETFENLENLLEHIRKIHFKESYIHHPQYFPCPYENCTAPTQQSLARLIYHFFEEHHTPSLSPWQCKNCKKSFSKLESLQKRHARGRCTFNTSSASASSSTDQQTSGLDRTAAVEFRSEPSAVDDGNPDKSKDFVTTQPLPCLWPSKTTGTETPCNEIFPDLEALLEHIRNTHIKASYAHTSIYWPCPHKDCKTPAKQFLSRLIYHFFEKHHTPQLKPWKCLNCATCFGSLESLQKRHARGRCTSSASSTSASSSTDVAPSGEK